jgi:tight adherence protein C
MMDTMSLWSFVLVAGGAMALLVWAGIRALSILMNPMRRRMQALRVPEEAALLAATDSGTGWLSRLTTILEPSEEERRTSVRSHLIQAGFRSPESVGVLYATRLFLMALLPAAFLSTEWLVPDLRITGIYLPVVVLAGVYLGWRLPGGFVNACREARQRALMEGFPDVLDLLVACTEAGLGLNAALERVVEQMPASHPELSAELSLVNAEIRAGVDRSTALRNLADRTGLDEIRGLVSLITHSARLGTGIAGTLRIYADEFRDRRMQRAEELAAKVGTKLIFPLVLCLFPAFFVVSIGPAILGVIQALSGSGLGGH